ncbi:MAG: RHS repeat-associated core domain-containing protein [Burkholderiales bacterium]
MANSQNAAGQVTGETLGNGLTATRSYDALFRLTTVSASDGGSTTPHSQTFGYDPIGNVTSRSDLTQSVTESLAYDTLNRLSSASGAGLTTRSFDYSAVGNMAYKSDVGTYTYPSVSSARPHAVSSVTGSGNPYTVTASYTYDANGSLTAASGTLYPATGSVSFSRTLTYTSFNMPSALSHTQGSSTYSYTYTYNSEHERVKLVTVRPSDTLTSIYLYPAGKGALMYEKETRASDGLVEHKHYVNGGAGLIGVYVTKSSYVSPDGPEMRYYHKDHLGSIAVITNPAGAVMERLAYEAFGERRLANGSPEDRASPLVGISTDRGFTGHEHLDEMMLIHMNGRIYDPVLARFMTADPFLQSPGNLQSYNRYSYVFNNPLMYTDPSGYFVHKNLKSLFKAAVIVVAAIYLGPEVLSAFTASAGGASAFGYSIVTASGTLGISLSTTGLIASGAIGGFAAGLIGGGDLESGLKGALSGALFGAAGTVGGSEDFLRYAAHAGAGCISGELGGGGCGGGAISAVAGKFATNFTERNPIAAVVAGGTASVLGGGKFANGATTAAFGYLFNQCAGKLCFGERVMSGQVRDDIFDYGAGLGEGAVSIAKGVGNSFRFMARGFGLMGAEEQLRWQAEGLAVDAALKEYATNSVVRSQANAQIYDAISDNASARNIGRFVGRSITGSLLAPAGGMAAIGDGTRAVERAGVSGAEAARRILFGY